MRDPAAFLPDRRAAQLATRLIVRTVRRAGENAYNGRNGRNRAEKAGLKAWNPGIQHVGGRGLARSSALAREVPVSTDKHQHGMHHDLRDGEHSVAIIQSVSIMPTLPLTGSCDSTRGRSWRSPPTNAFSRKRSLWVAIGTAMGMEGRTLFNLGVVDMLSYRGPQVNIQHDPRWGRNSNSPSEDPVLTGEYGAALVTGTQAPLGGVNQINSQMKHWAGCAESRVCVLHGLSPGSMVASGVTRRATRALRGLRSFP